MTAMGPRSPVSKLLSKATTCCLRVISVDLQGVVAIARHSSYCRRYPMRYPLVTCKVHNCDSVQTSDLRLAHLYRRGWHLERPGRAPAQDQSAVDTPAIGATFPFSNLFIQAANCILV